MNRNVRAMGGNGRTSMTIWREVEDTLEEIIDDYERVNHVISLYQDDRVRWRGLAEAGSHEGVGLELGSGLGNFTQMLHSRLEGFLICLDYSAKMLSVGRTRNRKGNIGFIRGILESLPIREGIVSFAAAAFALRDSIHKQRALMEISQALRYRGVLLIVDIGKPDNPIVRGVFSIYMRYIVPILGGLTAGYGYKNPWTILHKTFELLPENRVFLGMLRHAFGLARLEEFAFGGLIIALAEKMPQNFSLD